VVHTRFSRWARSGVWKRIFEALSQDADNEYASIDSTIVRACAVMTSVLDCATDPVIKPKAKPVAHTA